MEKENITIKKCQGCGHREDEPLGLNKYGEPYLACCPDNDYRNITAVQWLSDEIKKLYDTEKKLPLAYVINIIQKAKQIEQYQIVTAFDNGFFCGRELETDDEGRNYFKYVYYTKPGTGETEQQ